MRQAVWLLACLPFVACSGPAEQPHVQPPRSFAVGDSQIVKSISFSPDGATLIVGGQNKRIKIVSVADGNVLWASDPQPDAVLVVRYSPDGRFFTATCGDNTENTAQVVVFDTEEKAEVWGRKGLTNDVQFAEFSPDGTQLITANHFNITLYAAKTGEQLKFFSGHSADVAAPSGHVAAVTDIEFSKNGSRFFSVGWDRSVKVWDINMGREIKTYPEADPINACLLTPGEDRIISGGEGGIQVWNLTTDRADTVITTGTEIRSFCWVKSGEYFVSGDAVGLLTLWRTKDLTAVRTVESPHHDGVWSLASSPDGERFASSGGGGNVTLWDVRYLLRPAASDSAGSKS